ncbi:DUF6311 domain-containing protein [Paraburkholderia ferrariae]|uniref:DUF6311 domain-containing protein n=1 Tax=Paraburkholderia ferrariae TaxID=386056 RepID=A0ABU9RSD9_9BURK
MDFQEQKSKRVIRELLIPCAVGFTVFLIFCGPGILNPQNLDWILATPGDPTQHYVGWNFFRHTPILQWPLGLNPGYGEAISSSIVFSDSIPLFALFFKLWRNILPTDFQYFGIWIALCFILQSLFAWQILSRYSTDTALRVVGCTLLCLTPAMLWRLLGHEALVGHWLLLAGLYLYLRDKRTVCGWLLLIAAAALIHPYLLAMVGGLWAASFLEHYLVRKAKRSRGLLEATLVLALVFVTTTAAGYFVVHSVETEGFGYYRMNITSPLHPNDIWSIFRTTPTVNGDYEGFAYPGAGVFLLAFAAAVTVMRKRGALPLNWRSRAPLIALCVLFYVYALSNRIAFGSHEIFHYMPPRPFDKIFATFRSSGRFVWPVIYAVEILLIFAIVRLTPRKVALCILSFCVLLQAVDLTKASVFFHRRWSQEWSDPLVSEFWKKVPKHYRRIALVMPLDAFGSYGPIALLASKNGMTINGGYLARPDTKTLNDVQQELMEEMETGKYRSDTLYIFNKDVYWNTARQHDSGAGLVGLVDSYRVIAPGWTGCCKSSGVGTGIADIDMTNDLASAPYLKTGWSSSETAGRWTDGTTAQIWVNLPPGEYQSVRVTMDFAAFVNAQHPVQRIKVVSGDVTVAQWTVDNADRTVRYFDIPVSPSAGRPLLIELELPDAKSPHSLGMSPDVRPLAINVNSIKVLAN